MTEYIFRPKARIVSTIGADIIKDNYAAIIELVKNAYDADAKEVSILFEKLENGETKITIKDTGHGMSIETMVNNWLVPATDNKLRQKNSPMGRKYQGRKGIGRFAAAVLGQRLVLSSVHNKKQISVDIDWKEFETANYLDQVRIPIDEKDVDLENGTKFEIYLKTNKSNDCKKYDEWKDAAFSKLIRELRKTMTPLENDEKQDFEIVLTISPELSIEYHGEHEIKPYPILNLFSYRAQGNVSKGLVDFVFENNIENDIEDRHEHFNMEDSHICGDLTFDFRIFDRDPVRLEAIIRNEAFKGENPTKSDIKQLINEICGVYVYRDGFRIRPYGDEGFDWLSLDKRRVQDPSVKLGSDQIFGVINIAAEEISNLVDKSARDGLKDNDEYENFKTIVLTVIARIETARRSYRKTSGIGVKKTKIVHLDDKLSNLVSNKGIADKVDSELKNIAPEDKVKLSEILVDDSEKKEKIVVEIQKEIAIYHGQATLGKILDLIMHEARKPLGWFINSASSMPYFLKAYKENKDEKYLDKVFDQTIMFEEQAKLLDSLFKRLNPLSSKKRSDPTKVSVIKCVNDSLAIFENSIKEECIEVNANMPTKVQFLGWKQDLVMALTNIIENSIYWLKRQNESNRKLTVSVIEEENEIRIEILDTGEGIKKEDIVSGVIFEPGISNKDGGGTGLGLPIAGEAIARNGGELSAIECDTGALFQIRLPKVL